MDVDRFSCRLRLVGGIEFPQSPVQSPLSQPAPSEPAGRRPWNAEACCRFPGASPLARPQSSIPHPPALSFGSAPFPCRPFPCQSPANPLLPPHLPTNPPPLRTLASAHPPNKPPPNKPSQISNFKSQIPPLPAPWIPSRIFSEPDSTHYPQRTSRISGLTAILHLDIVRGNHGFQRADM